MRRIVLDVTYIISPRARWQQTSVVVIGGQTLQAMVLDAHFAI